MHITDLHPTHRLQHWLQKNRLLLLRFLVVAGALLGSVAFALYGLSLKLTLLVVATPVVLVGTAVLLRWPPLGFVLLIVASHVFKMEVIYVIGTAAVLASGLTALWLFDMAIIKRQFSMVKSRTTAPLFLFVLVTILAFINGQLPWYPVTPAPLNGQFGGILILVISVAVYLMVANQVRDERWLMAIVFMFILVGAGMIFGRMIPFTLRLVMMVYSQQVASGGMFWTWIVPLSFTQAVFNKTLHIRWRAALMAVTLGALYISLGPARAWVSGWLPPLVALMVALWVGMPRQAFMATLFGGLAVLTQIQSLMDNLLYIGDNSYSETTRLEAWRIIGEIVKISPLLGLGPANYSYYTQLFPILGWYVQFNSHNQYVDIVAQTGILGLICILWFAWEILRLAWRLHQIVPKGGFLEAYVYGTLGGIVATFAAGMLGDWFLPYVYNATIRAMRTSLLPWIFMGGLVAIEQMLLARKEASGQVASGK
ncbi:MAG: O-antigen ligase family protein [Ardenticatenaceae bacterium]|nr:O-antigen ligase family protein [Anaerolineales bacterium]MCB8923770.1 O-antigen ligase family protein [Ardenticatenaceae bacterium]MCB8990105.1 O-antigen ligase family protein [Ardenticatenaceae bacterium]